MITYTYYTNDVLILPHVGKHIQNERCKNSQKNVVAEHENVSHFDCGRRYYIDNYCASYFEWDRTS